MQVLKANWYKYILCLWIVLIVVIGCGKCESGFYDADNTTNVREMVMPSAVIAASVEYIPIDSTRDGNINGETTTTVQTESSTEEETTTLEETTSVRQETTTSQETTTKRKETTTKKEETTTKLNIDVNDYDSVRKVVDGIVKTIISPGMSEFDMVLAIHDWITFNIDYDFTYSNFYVGETLRDGTAVCQGYALTFDMMAELAGIECIFIGGEATNSSGQTGGHAWNQVKVDGVWYCIDTTWDDPASENKDRNNHSSNRYDYFLLSNETFDKNHTTQMEKKDCPYDYDRKTVLKAAVASGVHKNVRYADSVESGVLAISNAVESGQKEFTLWYYDTTVTRSNMGAVIKKVIAASEYSVSVKKSYYPKGGVTKYILKIN